jgi:membrane fusion protein (multidrug efflux system)
MRHIDIRSLETGYIQAIPIKEVQAVKTGDLLFEIIPVLHKARWEEAVAERDLAQLELNYTMKLVEKKSVSREELKLYEAKLARAQAKADLTEAELNFTKVKAPFDGIIDRFKQQQGSLVQEGDVVATLSDNSQVRVYFDVPEARYLEHMAEQSQREGEQQIELILANGKKFNQLGKFQAIKADFNSETGTIPFFADFPNPDRLLRHGQRGTVLISRVLKDTITIPQRATFEVRDKRYVYVVDKENVAHLREVVISQELEDVFVIKKGVGVEDKIVLEGIRQVHDGEKVEYEDHGR